MKRTFVDARLSHASLKSKLELMCVHEVLALFCTVEELFELHMCSQNLFKKFMPIFVSRRQWRYEHLAKLSERTQEYVRRVIVSNWEESVNSDLPRSLTQLNLDIYYNDIFLDNVRLPEGLLELRFGDMFNQTLPSLPSHLTCLVLGNHFNQRFEEGVLPRSLKQLTVGRQGGRPWMQGTFDETIDHDVLPAELTTLQLSGNFNKSLLQPRQIDGRSEELESVLPKSLKRLVLSDRFDQSLEGVLPAGLTRLQFGSNYNRQLLLPSGLRSLTLSSMFNDALVGFHDKAINFQSMQNRTLLLPPKLKYLKFGKSFNQTLQVGALPASVKTLSFGTNFNQELLPGVLPAKLTKLTFGGFNLPLPVLPALLTKLAFKHTYNQPIPQGVLPHGLLSLRLGTHFNQIIQTLPVSLTSLKFDAQFNQPLQAGILPSRLRYLDVGPHFNHSLQGVLPSTLLHLNLGAKFGGALGVPPPSLKRISASLKIIQVLKDMFSSNKMIKVSITEYTEHATLFIGTQPENSVYPL